jgi:hypothetical protein
MCAHLQTARCNESAMNLSDSGDYQDPACCEKVIVTVPGPDPAECDPYMSLTWCDGGGDCVTTQPAHTDDPDPLTPNAGSTGCPGGGGVVPPPSPPPPNEPGDTCNTGDAVVDDPKVSDGMKDLWARSNPDANLAQRRETAGWIVQTASGFSIAPITTTSSSFGCAAFTANFPTSGTVVGFVHTHPYQVDETIVDCDLTTVQSYTGAPSDADRRASAALGSLLGRSDPLPGYIIDKDGYYRFVGTSNTATPRLPRCGY